MNKPDLEKCEKEGIWDEFLEKANSEFDRIAKTLREKQDNAMAMEFTRTIAELLRENGIAVHCTETSYTKDLSDKSIENVYGVVFDSVDCTEHDKEFKDEIAKLKENVKQLDDELTKKDQIIRDVDEEVVYLKKQLYGEKYNHKNHVTKVEELQNKIAELESELSVKENLLKIKNGLCREKPRIHIIGLREFDGEQYMRYSDVEELIKELEE